MPKAKSDATNAASDGANNPSLVICRNKHWRYISCYHGPWFQLPPELLQQLAYENYIMPQPRLIDPAVFFDIVKIRRYVDEATEDAVRANCGTSSTPGSSYGRYDPFSSSSTPAARMSKERIHRVRQKAVKLLAQAYALDEVATSVVTMQSSSALEDVAEHVLRRDKDDADAKYVHFFHEKVPSRSMEQHTPLAPLDEVILKTPLESQAGPLRTRGLVEIMKLELEHSAEDFTYALRIAQELKARHRPGADQLVLAKNFKKEQEERARNPRALPRLKDEDQPSSMEQQILFNRAGVYLSLACESIPGAILEVSATPTQQSPASSEVRAAHLAARKRVKTYAKRAWKDYMAFIGMFSYTPGFPVDTAHEVMRRITEAADHISSPRKAMEPGSNINATSQGNALIKMQDGVNRHKHAGKQDLSGFSGPECFPASLLFAEKPVPNLPEFPPSAMHPAPLSGLREAVTYHPLLIDAVHSLLLCHCLLQTSSTELHRHAQSAARIARIADGYPVFQAPRSPAKADWIDILRRGENWIKLDMPWSKLCEPLALATHKPRSRPHADDKQAVVAHSGGTAQADHETEDERKARIQQQSILEALGDERVVDEETFKRSLQARQKQALVNEERDAAMFSPEAATADGKLPDKEAAKSGARNRETPRQWAKDEASKEYPVSSQRAELMIRWIRQAPSSSGGNKKKKGGKKRRPASSRDVEDVTKGVADVNLGAEQDEDLVD